MATDFAGTHEEAQFLARLVNAWSAAQTVVEQLTPVLNQFGLLKPNGHLDTERILEVHRKARVVNG